MPPNTIVSKGLKYVQLTAEKGKGYLNQPARSLTNQDFDNEVEYFALGVEKVYKLYTTHAQ